MTPRATYVFAIGLFALLGIGIVAAAWMNEQVEPAGIHGPVALICMLPFIVLFAIGALILAVLALRARLRPLTIFIGVLPMVVVIFGSFGIVLVLLTG
jgi:hypothetical protein